MQSFLSPLPQLKVITVSGEQRQDYLHGQITVDTKSFETERARFAAHCDFKGKMWANFVLTQYNDSFHLIMPESASNESITQLKKYGVFSKVEIASLDENWHILGGTGEELTQELKALFPNISKTHMAHCTGEFGEVITFSDANLRYLIVINTDGFKRLQDAAADYFVNSPELWSMLEIQAGLGFVEGENIGEFVPQMFNLHAIDGIDFDKGCYMGQEVVARTKFLGKNKRALYILEAPASDEIEIRPGDTLEKSVGENWRRGGTVIKASNVDGVMRLLAVLANDTELNDVLRLKASEQVFSVMPLPYAIES